MTRSCWVTGKEAQHKNLATSFTAFFTVAFPQDTVHVTALKAWGKLGIKRAHAVELQVPTSSASQDLKTRLAAALKVDGDGLQVWRSSEGSETPAVGPANVDEVLVLAPSVEEAAQIRSFYEARRRCPPSPGGSVGVGSMPGTPMPGTPIPAGWTAAGPRAAPQTPPGIAQAQPLTPRARAARIQFLVDRLASDAEELRALLRQA